MISQLILSHLKKTYTVQNCSTEILCDISYTFSSDATYGICGPSGVGKSTLLHIIAGLDAPTAGAVTLNDQFYFLDKIGFMFQQPHLINELTVLENVILKGLVHKKNYLQCEQDGILLLDNLGLSAKKNHFPSMLSGGEQQRVALARALFSKPLFIVADEPTSNLDEVTGKKIVTLLQTWQQEWKFGLIVCSHDAYVLAAMQKVLQLKDGKLNVISNHQITAFKDCAPGKQSAEMIF